MRDTTASLRRRWLVLATRAARVGARVFRRALAEACVGSPLPRDVAEALMHAMGSRDVMRGFLSTCDLPTFVARARVIVSSIDVEFFADVYRELRRLVRESPC